MTIPRELSFKNNRLYQNPIRELETLKTDEQNSEIQPEKKEKILNQQERLFELEFSVSQQTSGTIKIILGNTEDEYVLVKIDLFDGKMVFTNAFFLSQIKTDLLIRNETSQKINCKTWKLQKEKI